MPQQPAEHALAAGRFREAIGLFKDLLKSEVRPQWREGLAAAYAGRARELTEKGMLKEALVIWQNRQQVCPTESLAPEYLALLLRIGNARQAIEAYLQAGDGLGPEERAALRGLFAATYLADPSALDEGLPADDPIRVHGTAARAALEAYCRGDDAAAEETLRGLPFRSPYRDWVQVLRALLRVRDDPAGARELLQRVPPDSAFAPVQKAAQLALLPEPAFLTALGESIEAERRFAAALRGWSVGRLALWEEARRLGDPPPPLGLLGLMQRRRQVLGDAWVHRHGLRLLTADFPQSLHWPRRLGGKSPSSLEENLVAAWHAEDERDGWVIFDAWSEVIEAIRAGSDVRAGDDDALRMALIQRRLAIHWRLLEGSQARDTEALLEESLRLDPDDRAACLLLGAHYRRHRRLQDARRVLDQALRRWPEAVDVLGEALETAVAGDAFKKAGGFARRILTLDPVNRRAKRSLFEAHLSHARKQLRQGRAALAQRELDQASDWANGTQDDARRDLLLALSSAGQAPDGGAARLASAVERLGGGMAGQLELVLEAASLGVDPAAGLRRAGLRIADRPQRADLLSFCQRLREKLDAGGEIPAKALQVFVDPLRAGSALELSHPESEAVCETLRRQAWNPVRRLYARAALKRWPGEPVFELHALEASHDGPFRTLSPAEVDRAERAAERARSTGDVRTAHRLSTFLEATFAPRFLEDDAIPMPEGPEVGIDDADLDALIKMIASGPMRGELQEMERRMGRERMREAVRKMLADLLPDEDDLLPPAPRRRRGPRKTGGKPRAARQGAGPGSAEGDGGSSEDPDTSQSDLFE